MVGLYAQRFTAPFNGSLSYAPVFVVLVLLGLLHARRQREAPGRLLVASAVLLVSLACRTVDPAACQLLPIGTHFLWHLLNAVVLYLCGRSLPPREATLRRNIQS